MPPPLPSQAGGADDRATVLLVRHGHVEGVDPPRFRGRRDLPLTPLGQRQAQMLGQRIAAQWSPTAIFTSPLGRCVATAAAIAQPFHLDPVRVPELLDLDYGTWQGLALEDARKRWPQAWMQWRDAPQLASFPQGESVAELATRVTNAAHRLVQVHAGETLVIVAHDSVNRVLLLHALNLPLSRYHTLAQAPCALNVLHLGHGRFTVETLNETGHLLAC